MLETLFPSLGSPLHYGPELEIESSIDGLVVSFVAGRLLERWQTCHHNIQNHTQGEDVVLAEVGLLSFKLLG